MTKEEAVKEIEKAFEPAFANYIITALTEGATVSDKEPTTKNDLGVDCISRIETIDYLCKHCPDDGECFKDCDEIKHLRQMPSVTPQEPQTFKWCTNCKEYDQEKHCCHRWSNVIRDTVEEMKQEYIEREVLDEIRAEIEEQVLESLSDGGDDWFTAEKVNECLDIIDTYKAESEG